MICFLDCLSPFRLCYVHMYGGRCVHTSSPLNRCCSRSGASLHHILFQWWRRMGRRGNVSGELMAGGSRKNCKMAVVCRQWSRCDQDLSFPNTPTAVPDPTHFTRNKDAISTPLPRG